MFLRRAIFLILAGTTPILAQTEQDKQKTIPFEGRQFHLTETGTHAGGEFARYILPGEDPDNYTIKLGTLLCEGALNNDPIDTANASIKTLQENPALVFMDQILVNRKAPAAIIIFGYKFPDGDFQLNVWKYEKRLYGVYCDQIMVAAPKGQDAGAFKIWAKEQKDRLVKDIATVRWSPSSNQSFIE